MGIITKVETMNISFTHIFYDLYVKFFFLLGVMLLLCAFKMLEIEMQVEFNGWGSFPTVNYEDKFFASLAVNFQL